MATKECRKCCITKPIKCFYIKKKRELSQKCDECRSSKDLQYQQKKVDNTPNMIPNITIDQEIFKMWLCFQADIDSFNAPLYEILPHVMAAS